MPVAVVTGSNKGIGFATVRALCSKFQGDVILTSRDETRGREAVESLKKEGLNPKYHVLDICDEDSVQQLYDYLKKNYAGIDVLVNNAGIAFQPNAPESRGFKSSLVCITTFVGIYDLPLQAAKRLEGIEKCFHRKVTGSSCYTRTC